MSGQEGESSPAPVAIDVGQTGLTHPSKLVFDARQSILRIVVPPTDQVQKLPMKLGVADLTTSRLAKRPVGINNRLISPNSDRFRWSST